MNQFNFAQTRRASGAEMDMSVDAGLRKFMLGVFNKMALGLALTGILAFVVGSNEALTRTLLSPPLGYVIMFGPLAILLGSAFLMKRPSPMGANIVYWSVATLIGLSMGGLVYAYGRIDGGMLMVAKAFLTTSIAFGGLSMWGYTTKKDLSGWGTFLIMGVIGLIVAMVLNMFIASSLLGFAISAIGLLLFAGLTAYDTQRLKFQYYELGGELAGDVGCNDVRRAEPLHQLHQHVPVHPGADGWPRLATVL